MFALNTLAIGAASLFAIVAADHGHSLPRAHHHNSLERRFAGTATYYLTGLGACGQYNVPSDYIVALNTAQYGSGSPGPQCFKQIKICRTSSGVCRQATIMDECPTCDYGSLDLSEGIFTSMGTTDEGVFQMTWSFVDGASDPDPPKTTKTTKKAEPTTTWTPEPEPTTSWTPEPTTSKKKTTSSPPPETTWTPESTTSTSSTHSEPKTTSTSEVQSTSSSKPAEAATSTPGTYSAPQASATNSAAGGSGSGSSSGSGSGSNWQDLNQVMLAMGRAAVVANGGQA